MKKLSELNHNTLLIVNDDIVDKSDFEQYLYLRNENDNTKVYIAEEVLADFDLEYAIECISDEMHDEWVERVIDSIPREVRERIENEINSYLKDESSYCQGEEVDWRN